MRDQAQQAEVKTNREQEEAKALYPEAQELAVDICDTAEYFYRKDPEPSSRRAKCRRWGVVYIYDTNEPIDPGDTTGQTTGGGAPPPEPPPAPPTP